MKTEIQAMWVAALRSGEYQQAKGMLKRTSARVMAFDDQKDGELPVLGYCCLGVLCDLYIKETGDGKWAKDGEFVYTKDGDPCFEHDVLPSPVYLWAGLENSIPAVSANDEGELVDDLSSLNDEGKTFAEIADLIEKGIQ